MAVKRVLRYIKGTLDLKLTLRTSKDPHLVVYADDDFAGEPEGNEFPMWSLSLSTAVAEYKTFTIATKLVDVVRQFLEDIGFPQTEPTVMYNEDQAAIAMSDFQY